MLGMVRSCLRIIELALVFNFSIRFRKQNFGKEYSIIPAHKMIKITLCWPSGRK